MAWSTSIISQRLLFSLCMVISVAKPEKNMTEGMSVVNLSSYVCAVLLSIFKEKPSLKFPKNDWAMKRLGCLIQPWNIFSLITVADMEYIHAKETVLILVMKTNGKQSSFFFFLERGTGTGGERKYSHKSHIWLVKKVGWAFLKKTTDEFLRWIALSVLLETHIMIVGTWQDAHLPSSSFCFLQVFSPCQPYYFDLINVRN